MLADETVHTTPKRWAQRVVAAYHRWGASRVVVEANNGKELVTESLKAAGEHVPIKVVNASRGNYVRAEPISTLYEHGRISHAGTFPALEDELCSWLPASSSSPDRLDALVWAMTDLMLGGGIASAPQLLRQTPRLAPIMQRARPTSL